MAPRPTTMTSNESVTLGGRFALWLAIVLADRREDVDHLAGRERRSTVRHAAGDERDHARFENGRLRADGKLEATLDHVGQLLVRMLVHGHDGVRVQRDLANRHGVDVDVATLNGAVENRAWGDVGELGKGGHGSSWDAGALLSPA